MGRVDVNMTRYRNDEFGLLVDEYSKVIENIKYQAKIAEEVSQGNLTVNVVPRSGEDVLGYSLKKLVDDNFRVMTNITDVVWNAISLITLITLEIPSEALLISCIAFSICFICSLPSFTSWIALTTRPEASFACSAFFFVFSAISSMEAVQDCG